IGSNVEDADLQVERAISHLRAVLSDMRWSSVYRTPSVSGDGSFYSNAVAAGFSSFSSSEMERICKTYEAECGREKGDGKHVVVDLDVIIANSEILRPKDAARSYFTIGFDEIG
ncbi:MAG: 2-amino-4-hydroxy-6-hydroxymethyldihydropteridine diphosphokinase, partial [Paramuribaculum sp.]|nr:2-amino-4-hydroxy-6-hydroxymethyldihydropteridine diphosphokinase [Paramuribaculum sp.]